MRLKPSLIFVEIMRNKRATSAARVNAAGAILDRAYGKAPQAIAVDATFSWAKLVEESMKLDKPEALEPPAQKIIEGKMITKAATVRPED